MCELTNQQINERTEQSHYPGQGSFPKKELWKRRVQALKA